MFLLLRLFLIPEPLPIKVVKMALSLFEQVQKRLKHGHERCSAVRNPSLHDAQLPNGLRGYKPPSPETS